MLGCYEKKFQTYNINKMGKIKEFLVIYSENIVILRINRVNRNIFQ